MCSPVEEELTSVEKIQISPKIAEVNSQHPEFSENRSLVYLEYVWSEQFPTIVSEKSILIAMHGAQAIFCCKFGTI